MRQKKSGTAAYDKVKERARKHARTITQKGQDVGAIPPPVNFTRRLKADNDFQFFCESYFPDQYNLAWSKDHLRIIKKIERVICDGETMAVAMPRGSGKTTLCQTAVIWAMLTGRHSFVFLIAGTDEKALDMLKNIKTFLTTSIPLLEDYPEAIVPICMLEGEARRATGQRYYGVRTHIGWSSDEIIMPTIPGSRCSGGVVRVSGITGNIRGALFVKPDGESIRPSLAIVDDPQTDESARSESQIHNRLKVINGAILGLTGPGKKMSAIIPCTVIQEGDLADRLLDLDKNPLWQGERTKMVYSFPSNKKMWAKYEETRDSSFKGGGNGSDATEFYRKHKKAMDRGSVVAWPARFNEGELSALQHAMNLMFRDEAAFFAEYQNEPIIEQADEGVLKVEDVLKKINGRDRGSVPLKSQYLTMFIDVHDKLLFYVVCAWDEDFTGYIVDYGTWPDQRRKHFAMHNITSTLSKRYKTTDKNVFILKGMEELCTKYLNRDWKIAGGKAKMRISRCLIDSGYKPGVINSVIHRVGGVIMASRGVGLRAAHKPMSSYRKKPGERHGHHWYIPTVIKTREFKYVAIDTNYWKSFVHERMGMEIGSEGGVSIYGKTPAAHQLFAEHIAGSEMWTLTMGHGREVHEWKTRKPTSENHWLDCMVGCCTAASMSGCKMPGQYQSKKKNSKPLKLSDIQKRKGA